MKIGKKLSIQVSHECAWTRSSWNDALWAQDKAQVIIRQKRNISDNRIISHYKTNTFKAVSKDKSEELVLSVSEDGKLIYPPEFVRLHKNLIYHIPPEIEVVSIGAIKKAIFKIESEKPLNLTVTHNEPASACIANSLLHGIVTEHLEDAVVIRFNVEGESEEREFFWSDLKVTREELPVGKRVIGKTELLLAPDPPTEEEAEAEMNRIIQNVEADLRARGVDADKVIGAYPHEVMQNESDKSLANSITKDLKTLNES